MGALIPPLAAIGAPMSGTMDEGRGLRGGGERRSGYGKPLTGEVFHSLHSPTHPLPSLAMENLSRGRFTTAKFTPPPT